MFEYRSNRPAVFDLANKQVITYGELYDLGSSLVSHVPSRSLVFLISDWSIATIAFYVGCIEKRIPIALLPKTISLTALEELSSLYKPTFIMTSEEKTEIHVRNYAKKYNANAFQGNFVGLSEVHPDLAILISTSGTMGTPKFVRLSYNNIEINAKSIVSGLGMQEGDRAITTLPMSYSYGLSILNTHLICGGTIFLNDNSVIEKKFWDQLEQFEISTFAGVPTTYEMILRTQIERITRTSLRYVTQAGGPFKVESLLKFLQACKEKDLNFYKMYGQTEATARISILPSEELSNAPESVGYPVEGGSISIQKSEEFKFSSNEVGEVIFQGQNVSMGYANSKRDLSSGDVNLGTLRTGDFGYTDSSGRLYVMGRFDRVIKLDGIRVDLQEVEKSLREYDLDVVALNGNEKLVLVLENRNWTDEAKHNAFDLLNVSMSRIMFTSVGNFPRKSTGKIDYEVLRIVIRDNRSL